MVGLKYEPLFPYFADRYDSRAYFVTSDAYVKNDSGTGIVHQAPAFGEDDYRVCVRAGAVDKVDLPCPVDESGRFIEVRAERKREKGKERGRRHSSSTERIGSPTLLKTFVLVLWICV